MRPEHIAAVALSGLLIVFLASSSMSGFLFFSSTEEVAIKGGGALYYRAWTNDKSEETTITIARDKSTIARAVLQLAQVDRGTATSDVAYPMCASNGGGTADLYFNGAKLASFTNGQGASAGQVFSNGNAGQFGWWGCCGCRYEHDVTSLVQTGSNTFYFQQAQTRGSGYTKLYGKLVITVAAAAPTPTPTPAPTPTATPAPTPLPTATAAPSPTPTPTSTPSITPTTTPSPTATPTSAPSATATPAATAPTVPTPAIISTPAPAATPVAATPDLLPSGSTEFVLAGGKALYYRAWLNTVSDRTAFTLPYSRASIKQAFLELKQVAGSTATSDVPEPYCSSNKGGTAALYFNGAKIASFTQGSGASARQVFTGSPGKFGWWGCCGCLFRQDVTSLLKEGSNEFYFQQLATSLGGYTKVESARLVVSFSGTPVVAPAPSPTPRVTATSRPTIKPTPTPAATIRPSAAVPKPSPFPTPRPTPAPVPQADFISYTIECPARSCDAASDLVFVQGLVPKVYYAVTDLWNFERADKAFTVRLVAGGPFSAALWEEDRKMLTIPAPSKYDLNKQLGLPAEVGESDILAAVLSHEMTHYVVNGALLESGVQPPSVPLWAREGVAALGEDKVIGLLGRQKVNKFMYAKRQVADFGRRAVELKDKQEVMALAFWTAYPADKDANYHYGGAYSFFNYAYVNALGGSFYSTLGLLERLGRKDADSAFRESTNKPFGELKDKWYSSLNIPASAVPSPTPIPATPKRDCGWFGWLFGC